MPSLPQQPNPIRDFVVDERKRERERERERESLVLNGQSWEWMGISCPAAHSDINTGPYVPWEPG